jgi:hypothetical protein
MDIPCLALPFFRAWHRSTAANAIAVSLRHSSDQYSVPERIRRHPIPFILIPCYAL